MGSLLSRSSSNRSAGKQSRWRKGRGKRFQKIETSTEGDHFQNDNVQKDSNGHLVNTHEEWNERIDQEQIANINGDPPGAPSTYPTNFPMNQNDLMNQSWTSHYDTNNQFYQGNSHPMGTTSNIPYDPNQYVHVQNPNKFMNQSQQMMLEERPSKKVQFARPIEQQVQSKNPLTSTQSWHEPSFTNTDVSISTTKQDPVLTRQSVHRSLMPKNGTSLTSVPVQKPIYVGIDHRATLAERGQRTANKHHHKNSGDITTNHRTRPHTHHQHKHQESNDPSNSNNNISAKKSFEPLQIKLSGTNRPLTTTSTSTITPNKSIQHTEQPIFNDNEMKIPKTRGNRNHTEQQTLINNDTKLSRSRGNQQQQQRTIINRNNSPLRTETARRIENTQQGIAVNRNNSPLRTEIVRRGENMQQDTPVMRIPISQSQQQRQKQSTVPSAMITTANVTRTRV